MFYFLLEPILMYNWILILAAIVPALLHGAYDFIASMEYMMGGWYFVIFVVILFAVSFVLVNRMSKRDQYI